MSFYTDVLMQSPLFNTTSIVGLLDYLEPTFRAKIECIMADSAKVGMPLICFETYRSAQRQHLLFQQGSTQLAQVGVHHYGLAADLVKNVDGQPSWKGDFNFLRKLAHEYEVVSGIDWGNPNVTHSFVDACHIQAVAVVDQYKLFAGTWYPDSSYDPYKAD